MPHRLWSHLCCGRRPAEESICEVHGGQGVFAGWWPSASELTVRWVKANGLAPRGMHRAMAERILATYRDRCVACRGTGWLGEASDEVPAACPGCDGEGSRWNAPLEEVAAARDVILRVYPGAGVGWGEAVR